MKKQATPLILISLTVLLTFKASGQTKKTLIEFDKSTYIQGLNYIMNEINMYEKISWIFIHPVTADTISYDFLTQPEVEILVDNPIYPIEFKESDFTIKNIRIRNEPYLIDYRLSHQKDTIIYFQELRDSLGTGIIFSVPYLDNGKKYIDFQIIDWNVECGIGKYFRKELK